ncbi:hypothetical protein A2482_02125 [Candidatus Falkowbacteria bacterium RIFOXYC2_FULL_48_21]|uniref:Uncharacterized protein n=1 Tax=Candidatus Falkowbacteria bacterium RIFOXYC2_FULL_48_21 TaxID=1798005 RepID=A0A1F5T664_9BACT|nr:MAG: hypothetical protein A2482_02125 [Candidatus Falkowbacteria bacterium RIFOXYC2_FULL_48_21]
MRFFKIKQLLRDLAHFFFLKSHHVIAGVIFLKRKVASFGHLREGRVHVFAFLLHALRHIRGANFNQLFLPSVMIPRIHVIIYHRPWIAPGRLPKTAQNRIGVFCFRFGTGNFFSFHIYLIQKMLIFCFF